MHACIHTDGDMPADDYILATDWHPPYSASLYEEPVMYIGPDSVALVVHGMRKKSGNVLDVCCGSGIQVYMYVFIYCINVCIL